MKFVKNNGYELWGDMVNKEMDQTYEYVKFQING